MPFTELPFHVLAVKLVRTYKNEASLTWHETIRSEEELCSELQEWLKEDNVKSLVISITPL